MLSEDYVLNYQIQIVMIIIIIIIKAKINSMTYEGKICIQLESITPNCETKMKKIAL